MLLLGPRWRIACIVLQVILPGVGAIITGAKNPHTRYLKRGIAQLTLVIFGSYPLVIPGAIGLLWAWFDAVQIGRHAAPPGPKSHPTADAEPETLESKPVKGSKGSRR